MLLKLCNFTALFPLQRLNPPGLVATLEKMPTPALLGIDDLPVQKHNLHVTINEYRF